MRLSDYGIGGFAYLEIIFFTVVTCRDDRFTQAVVSVSIFCGDKVSILIISRFFITHH